MEGIINKQKFHPFKTLREFRYRTAPQVELFNILIKIFPDAEMEYKIGGRINKKGYHVRWADIGIPSLKLDFEYDGSFHKEALYRDFLDKRRDEELKMQGWETFRINYKTLEIIKLDINKFIKIINLIINKSNNDNERFINFLKLFLINLSEKGDKC